MQVQATTSSSNTSPTTSTSKDVNQLGKDDFMKLLMAQMRNQDPLKPMDDAQFISQLTQFSMLERLQEVEQRISTLVDVERLGQANALVGRIVEGVEKTTGEVVKGIVDSATLAEGEATLSIGEKSVALEDVSRVSETDASKVLEAAGTIGREATVRDPETGSTTTGVVKSVGIQAGQVMLRMGEQNVPMENLISVAGPDSSPVAGAGALVGKEVGAILQSSGQYVSGLVDSAKLEDGEVILSVGGRRVRLGEVTIVTSD